MTTRRLRRVTPAPARRLRRAAVGATIDVTVEETRTPEPIFDQVSGPFPHHLEAGLRRLPGEPR
jgi:hypothetical protein